MNNKLIKNETTQVVMVSATPIVYDTVANCFRGSSEVVYAPYNEYTIDNEILSVSPPEFKLLFTSQERIAIKNLIPTDDIIADWWSILEDIRLTQVRLDIDSTKSALDYLISINILTPERKSAILTGKL